MNIPILNKNQASISKAATIIIFLALIRSIGEAFRLNYYSTVDLTFGQLKPFLLGALITAISLLVITILSYYARHKTITAIAIVTILLLVLIKIIYLVP